jgi:hypothetical protein
MRLFIGIALAQETVRRWHDVREQFEASAGRLALVIFPEAGM